MSPRLRSRAEGNGVERKHFCDHPGCTKAFTRKEHLSRHKLNHQEGLKWPCRHCPKSFYRRDLLDRHGMISHGVPIPPNKRQRGSTVAPEDEQVVANNPEVTIHDTEISTGNLLDTGNPAVGADAFIDPQPEWMPYSHDGGMQWLFHDFESVYNGNAIYGLGMNGQPPPFNEFLNFGPTLLATSPSVSQSEPTEIELQLEDITSAAPSCNFAICHSLQPRHRDRLLWLLQSEFDIEDVADPLLSLCSLQHGLHFYFKHVSPEYSIFHSSLIVYHETKQSTISEWYGEELSWHLVWAMIILGWLCPSYTSIEDERRIFDLSTRIHEALRRHVLLTVASSPRPALSSIQLHFLSLVFARYHGRSEAAAGFAINSHGMLINIVERLDVHNAESPVDASGDVSTDMKWFTWIRLESLKRIISQTFILDVQQMMLHGNELRFSPFKLNFMPPCEDELWYAPSSADWHILLQDADSSRWTVQDHNFLNMLKHFWKHAPNHPLTEQMPIPTPTTTASPDTMFPAFAFSRTSRMILYGILAVAWSLRRRGDTRMLSFRTNNDPPRRTAEWATTELSSHVHTSFEEWISWWTSQTLSLSLKHVALTWRNCVCMFRLAHFLFGFGSADLQIVSGRALIEGRRVKASEHAASIRRAKQLLRQDSALHGVLGALKVIRDRLKTKFSSTEHCQHCSWTLYLAGLLSWLYGHGLRSGWQTSLTSNQRPNATLSASDRGLVKAGFAVEACETYLAETISGIEAHLDPDKTGQRETLTLTLKLRQPHVVLLVIVDLLAKYTEGRSNWLIEDAVVHLRTLVRSSGG